MIQVDHLTKYYGAHAAIRDLSFHIEEGEVAGFLGLNGAGKTTVLKILGCVLLPTSGDVRIAGQDVAAAPQKLKRRIGFLPDAPPLYDEMTVGEYLKFVARLRGVAAEAARARVLATEERTALRQLDGEVLGELSHGFRQRVGLAQALVHDPALLVLDEPTGGLDPVQIVEMRRLIRSLRGAHTILLSSHILSEISQTCDRLLVIRDGELVAQGSEAELESRFGPAGTVELEVAGAPEPVLAALVRIVGVGKVTVLQAEGGRTVVSVQAAGALRPELARAVVSAGLDLLRLEPSSERLESLFLKLTERQGPST